MGGPLVMKMWRVTATFLVLVCVANAQWGPSAASTSKATAKDIQCHACKAIVGATLKLLQQHINAGTKFPVSLSIADACNQQNFMNGNFPPPTLQKACREWLEESDALELVFKEAVAKYPRGHKTIEFEPTYQQVCWEESNICVGADLDASGDGELLVGDEEDQHLLSEDAGARAQLDGVMKDRAAEKNELEASERENKRKKKRYEDDEEGALEIDRQCHVCQAVVQEVVKKMQSLLDSGNKHPISLSVGDPCHASTFKIYNFSGGNRRATLAQEACENWLNAHEDDLEGGGLLENVFAQALSAVKKSSSSNARLDPIVVKKLLCYKRTKVCSDVDYLDVNKGPVLSDNEVLRLKAEQDQAERSQAAALHTHQQDPKVKAQMEKKARIKKERAAWEKDYKTKSDFWRDAQKCSVCKEVVRTMTQAVQSKLNDGVRNALEAALTSFMPCSSIVDSVEFEDNFFGASAQAVFEVCEEWLLDIEDGILLEEAFTKAMKGREGDQQLNSTTLTQKVCMEQTAGCAHAQMAPHSDL